MIRFRYVLIIRLLLMVGSMFINGWDDEGSLDDRRPLHFKSPKPVTLVYLHDWEYV
jgi:hypothetical protein